MIFTGWRLYVINAFLNFPIFLQLLCITLVIKKIPNVYNIAVTTVTIIPQIVPTLIFLLYLGCTKIKDAYPLQVRAYFHTLITMNFQNSRSQSDKSLHCIFIIKYNVKKYLDINHCAFSPLPKVRIRSEEQALDLTTSRAQLLPPSKS